MESEVCCGLNLKLDTRLLRANELYCEQASVKVVSKEREPSFAVSLAIENVYIGKLKVADLELDSIHHVMDATLRHNAQYVYASVSNKWPGRLQIADLAEG